MKKTLLLILMCFSSVANAAVITTFNDRMGFEAAAGTLATETFNSFTEQTPFHTTPLDVGDFSLSLTGTPQTGERNSIDLQPPQFSEFDVDGTTLANVLIQTGTSFFITFDNPIFEFGADFGSIQDGQLRTNVYVGNDVLTPLLNTNFFGLISDTAFSVLEFRADFGVGDGFGLDNVSYGVSPVPVPAAAWLFGSALLGFFGFSKRKKTIA